MPARRILTTLVAAAAIALSAGSLRAQDPQADPKARELMREVYEKRYAWDDSFPGFEATARVLFKGREYLGTARVGPDYRVAVALQNEAAQKWAAEQLASMASHRRGLPFEKADGRHPLTLGTEDGHPAGRLVRLNDGMNSTYRVRDGQITQVNRQAGPRTRFTIDIIESLPVDGGKFLPRVFTVAYFEAGGGDLERTDTFHDEYRKVGGYLLPESRRHLLAEDGSTEWRVLRLEDVRLLGAAAVN